MPGDLGAAVEIEQAQLLAQLDMIQRETVIMAMPVLDVP